MINDGTVKWEMNKVASELQLKNVEEKVKEVSKITGVPSWWLDRGDGSDGDFYPTANTTISGLKQYRSVFIPAGVTVTIEGPESPIVRMLCEGSFTNKGIITSLGQYLTASGTNAYFGGRGGGGYSGGNGGPYPISLNETVKDWMLRTGMIGLGAVGGRNSYGEAYGVGGGCIQIVCKEFNNIGTIDSSGSSGGSSHGQRGGGGGGGSVMVVCESLINEGTLLANGGGRYDGQGGLGEAGTVRIKELGGSI